VSDYIAHTPPAARKALKQIRAAIKAAAPGITERISYRMPTFYLNGNLVHFAAFQHHIGLYPAPSGIEAFNDELKRYRSGKGSVQFPLDQPLPLDLIARIVEHRVQENTRLKTKSRKKPRAS